LFVSDMRACISVVL